MSSDLPGSHAGTGEVRLRRRDVLSGLSALAVVPLAPLATGCARDVERTGESVDGLASAHPSPAAQTREDVARFVHLSMLLTGFARLDARLGRAYLESLVADPASAAALQTIYRRAGYGAFRMASGLAALEQARIFDDPALRAVTDRIITNWYSGIAETASGPDVVTFTHALVWHVEGQTPPTTRGGPPGFWALRPTI